MRVIVQENTGEHHDIRIPTGLALNRATIGIISKVCEKNGVNISKKQLLVLLKALRDYKRDHPHWKLVEVEEADGEHVEIIL
ncbi:MAG: hypothetical protein J6K04_08910 [Lachnospiraceae bacterium]|nr:hypothetical protein [Lachnospiraceae bacterium]